MNPNNGRLDLDWLDVALCAHNPDLGWLKDPHLVGLGEEATMSVICSRCPVLADCEAYVEAADDHRWVLGRSPPHPRRPPADVRGTGGG